MMSHTPPTPARAPRGRAALATLAAGLHRLAARIIYGDVLALLSLPGEAAPVGATGEATDWVARFLRADEMADLAAAGDTDLHLPYVAQAIARGDRCFAIFAGDRLASYSWYATLPTGVTQELALHFPSSYVYMHHSFTARAFRGRRLHALGIHRARAALAAEAQGTAVDLLAIVSTTNVASLKSCQRAGYRRVGSFWLLGGANRLGLFRSLGSRLMGCRLLPRRRDFAFLELPAA